MTRVLPKRIPLQSPIRNLRIEYDTSIVDEVGPKWLLWLTANGDFTLGSFIKLCYDGTVKLCTLHEDGSQTETTISED